MNGQRLPEYIWINGEIIAYGEALIHVMSPGVRYGISVLEALRGYWADSQEQLYVVKPRSHFERLSANAKVLQIPLPFDADGYADAILSVIRANQFREDVHIRNCLTIASRDPLRGTIGFSAVEPLLCYMAAYAFGRSYNISSGVRAGVSSWERVSDRSQPPRLKTGANYLNARLAQLEAKRHGYDVPILLNRWGNVAEGPGESVLIVRNQTIIAPSLTSDILEGITRSILLELAREELGITVEIRDVNRTELYVADEALFCGSGAEIVPICQVDGLLINQGQPGPVTKALQEVYAKYTRMLLPKYASNLLPVY
jgi:branched-chain amino acid aminotransferase